MKKIIYKIILFVAAVAAMGSLSSCNYNSLVDKQQTVDEAWAQVENQYQRRADLIPNLVNTVKGYSTHESETLQKVIEARAKATSVTIDAENLNEETLAKYQQAQGELSQALKSLLAVTEAYPDQIKGLAQDQTVYTWGFEDGRGDPIQMTILQYFDRYVYDRDYTQVPQIGVDRIMTGGNALENLVETYPDCRFVDFSFPSADPVNDGLDWSSLKLVFLPEGEHRYLVGVVHGEWTI